MMDKIDLANLLYYAADCIRFYERISALHDCNDCLLNGTCGYRPRPGDYTRINCPIWVEIKEDKPHEKEPWAPRSAPYRKVKPHRVQCEKVGHQ